MGCPLLKTGKKNIKTNNAIGRNKSINHLNSETNMNIEDDCTKSEQIGEDNNQFDKLKKESTQKTKESNEKKENLKQKENTLNKSKEKLKIKEKDLKEKLKIKEKELKKANEKLKIKDKELKEMAQKIKKIEKELNKRENDINGKAQKNTINLFISIF